MVDQMIKDADENEDNLISFGEFKTAMEKAIQKGSKLA